MVDAISTGTVSAADPRPFASVIAPVRTTAPVAAVAPVATPASQQPGAAAAIQLAALAKSMAAAAPVDSDRVAQIKQAIENGTFPILPATIADQMMAMRYDWMSHDEA